uniref:Uncharacterized protein n=1 Tax=Anguilla anguilla TaxID=7936 RepID=A0A0E9XBQ1_ANGAN
MQMSAIIFQAVIQLIIGDASKHIAKKGYLSLIYVSIIKKSQRSNC